jgi:hypothetical protein
MTRKSPPTRPIRERLLERLEVDENGCWIWQGTRDKLGYGYLSVKNRPARVHRLSYTMFVGPIPDGLVLDHLCRTPACANPEHLEAVTQRENTIRGLVAHVIQTGCCVHGHLVEGANAIKRSTGGVQCRECNLKRSRERTESVRALADAQGLTRHQAARVYRKASA